VLQDMPSLAFTTQRIFKKLCFYISFKRLWVAATCMQAVTYFYNIACAWNSPGFNFHACGSHLCSTSVHVAVTWVQLPCAWQPPGFNFNARGSYLGSPSIRVAATWVQLPCAGQPFWFNFHATGSQKAAS